MTSPGLAPPGDPGTLTVEVRVEPPYPVHIGAGLLTRAATLVPPGRVALVSDEHVAPLHADRLAASLEADGREVLRLIVPAGEGSKSVATWGEALRTLARADVGRDDVVLALGGGVVGDLAGFLAASYVRGVALVQAPTSLLAMADAAIGGKTGLNLPEGKNLVGAFWQPRTVLMDVATLRTLPPAVFAQGLVEVAKHGLLADPELGEAVLSGRFSREASDAELTRWVAASARVKARVVAEDERESSGARATLNLGHTVAHAFEAASRHALSHGEAVAWGLLYAAHLSRLHHEAGGESVEDWSEAARRLIRRVRPRTPGPLDWERLAPFLARDKKARAGRRRWVTMPAPGRARLSDDVRPATEREAWRAFAADVAALRPGEEGVPT